MNINENEKNRIKLLYGLITETAAPPDESVLVVNKNPFKYSEYQTARKFYNSNLKDGEMFFKTKETSGWKNGLSDYLSSKIIEKFNGKKIRWHYKSNDDDNIGTIGANRGIDTYVKTNGDTGTQSIVYFVLELWNDRNDKMIGELSFSPKDGFSSLYVDDIDYKELKNPNKKPGIPYTKVYKDIILQNNETMKSLVFSFSNWNTIPDELFEIRKIQRQKTDF